MDNEMFQILVADDDKEIADLVELYLVSDGYQVCKAYGGKEALQLFHAKKIDLAILDIMMPEMDGMQVCKEIRRESTIPIIMLSARDGDVDKIGGLRNGADDYITKPFNPLELGARVQSQIRRCTEFNKVAAPQGTVMLDNLTIDYETRQVLAYGKNVKCTPREFDILYMMASHPGKVFRTDELYEAVWKEKCFEASNTVMVHIRRLREKIERNPRKAEIIQTVWGVGYKIG